MCPDVLGDAAGDAGLDVAVDVGVGAGELQPERDVAVPACAMSWSGSLFLLLARRLLRNSLKPWLTTASSNACLLPKWW